MVVHPFTAQTTPCPLCTRGTGHFATWDYSSASRQVVQLCATCTGSASGPIWLDHGTSAYTGTMQCTRPVVCGLFWYAAAHVAQRPRKRRSESCGQFHMLDFVQTICRGSFLVCSVTFRVTGSQALDRICGRVHDIFRRKHVAGVNERAAQTSLWVSGLRFVSVQHRFCRHDFWRSFLRNVRMDCWPVRIHGKAPA